MKHTVCYVVQSSSGRYNDYRTWISGIFLDALDADNLRREIEFKNRALLEIPCPVKEEDWDILTKEQKEIFYNWSDDKERASEFNESFVTEMLLNKFIQ